MNDTRKDGRHSVSLVARYREPSMLELREGHCQDLSRNGMFIQTPRPSQRGALIRFECDAGRVENNFRGTGRVVWQRRKPDSRGPAGMGVRFVRLESSDHQALERVLSQLVDAARAPTVPSQPTVASGKLASTILGQPPVVDPRAGATGDLNATAAETPARSAAPSVKPAEGTPRSVRPPMPTLLEVPRAVVAADIGEAQAPAAQAVGAPPLASGAEGPAMHSEMLRGGETLLGVAAPNVARSGMPPGQNGESRPPQAHPRGSHPTIIESAQNLGLGGIQDDARGRGRRKGRDKRRSSSSADLREVPGRPGPQNGATNGSSSGGSSSLALRDPNAPFYGDRHRPDRDEYEDDEIESAPPKSNSSTVMWLVLGTGLVVSWGLVSLFGTVPLGTPTKPIEDAHEKAPAAPAADPAPAATPSESPRPAPEPARRYAVFIETRPPGARVAVGGQSLVAPARVELDSIQPPLVVQAELAGYKSGIANLWPSEFTQKGNLLEYRLTLDLQPLPAAAAPSTATPAPKAAAAPGPSRKPPEGQPARPARTAEPNPASASGAAPTSPSPRPEPAASPTPLPASEASPAPAAPRSASGAALAQALDCLSHGDNRCVVRVLENKANSMRELELLIETYRAMGATPKAEREMRRYVDSYPAGKHTAEYRRLLERRGAKLQ